MNSPSEIFEIENEDCINFVRQFTDIQKFVVEFRSKYRKIIAFHATRIDNEELISIKNVGLMLSSLKMLKNKAINRFVHSSDSQELQKMILVEIESYFMIDSSLHKSEINFVLNRRILEKNSCQYLIFGPETLLPLADKLTEKFQIYFRRRMIDFGIPYILKVEIPVCKTKEIWIKGIYEFLVNEFIESSLVCNNNIEIESIIDIKETKTPMKIY